MDITDLLSEHNVPFKKEGEHEHVRQGWVGIDCHQCSRGWGHYRLGYNIAHGYCSCWVCGSIPLREVLQEILGVSHGKAGYYISQIVKRKVKQTEKVKGHVKLPEAGELLDIQRDYLINRGFDPLEIESLWGVKGIGLHHRLAWRLLIPVTLNGKIVSWTSRSVDPNAKTRYITASPKEESYPIKSLLYGQDLVHGGTIVVVEGPTDAWKIGPGAVATMGAKVTQAQIKKIGNYPNRYICLDATNDAQRQARKLSRRLSLFPGQTKNIKLTSAKDPGDASPEEIKQIRALLSEQNKVTQHKASH